MYILKKKTQTQPKTKQQRSKKKKEKTTRVAGFEAEVKARRV